MLKISVKGSQDGGWGLTQGYKKGCGYHEAIDKWLAAHGSKTIFCLVQFKGVEDFGLPRMYLASPLEIAACMKHSRAGYGDTALREYYEWSDRSVAAGTVDSIPKKWLFTRERVAEMLKKYS